MIKYRVKITDIIEEVPGTKTYLLEKPSDFHWVEGSHTHIGLPGFDVGEKPNKNLVHHMSIMTLPEENKIGFTTRMANPTSEFKRKLGSMQVGDTVSIFKVGSRMFLRREDKPIVLLSMGVAIATMKPLVKKFIADSSNITNLTNINIDASKAFIYQRELDALENEAYKNIWVESRKDFYDIVDITLDKKDTIYYIAGSDDFYSSVISYLLEKEVERNRIVIDVKEEKQDMFFRK